jgi:hypothetical protein
MVDWTVLAKMMISEAMTIWTWMNLEETDELDPLPGTWVSRLHEKQT